MYKLKKQNGFHCAIIELSGMIQFKSLDRRRVSDWIDINEHVDNRLRVPEVERRRNRLFKGR